MLFFQGLFCVATYGEKAKNRDIIFAFPVADYYARDLGVKPIPSISLGRLTVAMVCSVAALHLGIAGIPAPAAPRVWLPTYRVHWVTPSGNLGTSLTPQELSLPLSNSIVTNKTVFIIPLINGNAVPALCSAVLPAAFAVFESQIPLAAFVTKTFGSHVNDGEDGPRQGDKFRSDVLPQDLNCCSISGDPFPDAAHIVDRYVGSSIFSNVLEAFAKVVELYHECDDEILASASNAVPLFADVRYAPSPTAGMPRIDQQDNGEALNQFLRRRKDNGRAHGVFPESGILVWFEQESACSRSTLPDFGGLFQVLSPPSNLPAYRLYSNPHGSQPLSVTRFLPRCLSLYTTFCHRFMPDRVKGLIIKEVAEATRVAEISYSSSHLNATHAGNMSGVPSGTEIYDIHLDGGVGRHTVDDKLPSSTSTTIPEDHYKVIWPGIARCDQTQDLDDKEKAAAKAGIERVFTDLISDNLSADELLQVHRQAVLNGIFLLHLGGALTRTVSETQSIIVSTAATNNLIE